MSGWIANLFCREKFQTLLNSVPLTMWASQHIEQCAIINSILTEGVKSFVTPQRERFMCAVKPFEVNCILLSFCACDILCSSLYGDGGRCSVSLAHALIQLCASLCTVSLCEHIFPFVFERSVCVSWFGPLHLNASVPGQWRIISEVLRCGGWLVAPEGWDTLTVTVTPLPRLWLVSRPERRPGGKDWKDSKTSNLGALMHRAPDDCNVLQLSCTISLILQNNVYYHITFGAIFQRAVNWWFTGQTTRRLKVAGCRMSWL